MKKKGSFHLSHYANVKISRFCVNWASAANEHHNDEWTVERAQSDTSMLPFALPNTSLGIYERIHVHVV